MLTRIEREKIVPRFRSRSHFFFWWNQWYQPSDHWDKIRKEVTSRGRCFICGGGRRRGDPFQAHHGKGAYSYLWREQEVMHLMYCAHKSCHAKIHRKKSKMKRMTLAGRVKRVIMG